MQTSTQEPMYILVQTAGIIDDRRRDPYWTPYSHQSFINVPMLHVLPFQQDAAPLFCMHKKDLKRLLSNLREQNYALFRPRASQVRYACHIEEVERKVEDHMVRTNAYVEIADLTQTTEHAYTVRNLIDTMTNDLRSMLGSFRQQHLITRFQYNQMEISSSLNRLDYTMFLPDTREQGDQVIFQPLTISCLSPLGPVCRYLTRLIAPLLYNQAAYSTTVYKGVDIIPLLELHQQQGYLQSTTLMATIRIRDLFTSVTHTDLLESLQRFLMEFTYDDGIQGMKICAILDLTKYVLARQYFVYEDKIYRQTTGVITGSCFSELLLDIYLFYWQSSLLPCPEENHLFVRCRDEIFLTWNDTESALRDKLTQLKYAYPAIEFDTVLNETGPLVFLDIEISLTDDDRCFETRVYHDWKYEPYALPNLFGGARESPWPLFRAAMTRAIRCCARVEDFDVEQRYIEYSFLFHRYRFQIVQQMLHQFYLSFHAMDFAVYHDQATYDELRVRVRDFYQDYKEDKHRSLAIAQTQCILYIYTTLPRESIQSIRTNAMQYFVSLIEPEQMDRRRVRFEIVRIPTYPENTV